MCSELDTRQARPRESGDARRVGVEDEGRVDEPSPRGHVRRVCPRGSGGQGLPPGLLPAGAGSEWWNRGSDTHSAFRRLTLNSRFTRSSARSPPAYTRGGRPAPARAWSSSAGPAPRLAAPSGASAEPPPMGLGGRRATPPPGEAGARPCVPVDPEGLVVHPANLPAQPPVATLPRRPTLRLRFMPLVLGVRRWGDGTSAQIGPTPYRPRWASMNDTIISRGGRAPSGQMVVVVSAEGGQIRRCLAQALVRTAQLGVLTLQLLETAPFLAGQPRTDPAVARHSLSLPRKRESAWRTRLRSVSAVHPSFDATEVTADHCESYSP